MERSAIILAGGSSSRFGQDKGLLPLTNKPLVKHVLDAVNRIVDEKIVVVSSEAQAENYATIRGLDAKVVVDGCDARSPLVGALTGFEAANGEYAVLLPCDTPLVSKAVISLLVELCVNKNAVIPRWPNGYIEPLQAVYNTKKALEAANNVLDEGKPRMQHMIDRLRGIRYVSTLVLQQLDPELKTFFNINTPADLKRAELMLKKDG